MRNKLRFEQGNDRNLFKIVRLLKACTSRKDLGKGSKLHAYIRAQKCLGKSAYIDSALVSMYAKCGALSKAKRALEELPLRSVVTWNALIGGYAQQRQGEEALKCFGDMINEGHSPDAFSFSCALKACASIGAAAMGKEVHDKIVGLGMLEGNVILGTALVDMYSKCGALSEAEQVHDELLVHDVVSWCALITGYAQQGKGEEALKCFDDMLREGHSPDAVTFASVLMACETIGAAAKAEEVHNEIVNLGMLERNAVLGAVLVDMYVKCGRLDKAQWVHEELPIRDVISWSALIAGYVQQGQGEEALKCFDDMLFEGHMPIAITFVYALKACASIGAATKGEEIHHMIASVGMLNKDIVLGTTLVNMYAKCGAFCKAQQLLKELPVRDVVSWNALIAGYAQQGQGEEVLKFVDDMLHEGESPDGVTFACALKACGSIGAANKGKEIHGKIANLGMLGKDTVLGIILMDMYAKCGALSMAQQVHEVLLVHDVISWNALIAGYAEQGQGEEALKCFDDMLYEGHAPTAVTFMCVLKACASLGVPEKGKEIHNKIVSLGMLENDIVLRNSVVDMYAKCGALGEAEQVLKEFYFCDLVSWSSIIAGYALQGQSVEAINCFERMLASGVNPDSIILSSVLTACSHSGRLDHAETYFSEMSTKCGIHPNLELYCCMADLFGRAGKFNKALSMIAEMPSDKRISSWVVLLGACRKWGEAMIGRFAFKRALLIDQSNAAVYLVMADIYRIAGMQEAADRIGIMTSKKPKCC